MASLKNVLKCLPITLDAGSLAKVVDLTGDQTVNTIKQTTVDTSNVIRLHGVDGANVHQADVENVTKFVVTGNDAHAAGDHDLAIVVYKVSLNPASTDTVSVQLLPDVNTVYTLGFYTLAGNDLTVHVGAPQYFQDTARCKETAGQKDVYVVVNCVQPTEGSDVNVTTDGFNYETRGTRMFYMFEDNNDATVRVADASWEDAEDKTLSYRLSDNASALCFILREGLIGSGIIANSKRVSLCIAGSLINGVSDAVDVTGDLTQGEINTAFTSTLVTLAGATNVTTNNPFVYFVSGITVAQLKQLLASNLDLADGQYDTVPDGTRDTDNFLCGTSGFYAELTENGTNTAVESVSVYSTTGHLLSDTTTMDLVYIGLRSPTDLINNLNVQQLYIDANTISALSTLAIKKTIQRDHTINATKYAAFAADENNAAAVAAFAAEKEEKIQTQNVIVSNIAVAKVAVAVAAPSHSATTVSPGVAPQSATCLMCSY